MEDNIVTIYIENKIVFVIANKKFDFDLNAAKLITRRRLEICNGKSYPTLFDYGENSKYASKEARLYFTNEGEEHISAAAFVASDIASRLFINCYLVIHKPNIPNKLFSNRERAINWLKQVVL